MPFLNRFVACVIGLALVPSLAFAQAEIVVRDFEVEPIPIAIVPFAGDTPEAQTIAGDVTTVVRNDLVGSGLFRAIEETAFIEQDVTFDSIPRFQDWRVLNAQGLLVGSASLQADGFLRVSFRLWEVPTGRAIGGLNLQGSPDAWRRIAHRVSDLVYEQLTGDKGYFDTRIVYVDETGPKNARIKRLAIMDYDGANHEYLTDGTRLVLTPRFSPKDPSIMTYLSYEGGQPTVYLYDITTRRREVLGDFPGMSFAPAVSPDGNQVVMSLARDGNSDIYIMDLRTRTDTRLTSSPAIDTSPSFSPDGERIVFNSDRGGSQQIYVMNADGSDVRRISFGDGRYATPVWSPRGDLIAFTKITKGKFSIGVMAPDGSGERILTESFLDEGPTWAPNGRVLMFFRQTPGEGGSTRLWSVNLSGQNLSPVNTPKDASDPAWSPSLN